MSAKKIIAKIKALNKKMVKALKKKKPNFQVIEECISAETLLIKSFKNKITKKKVLPAKKKKVSTKNSGAKKSTPQKESK